jgi:hypothetical protein
MNTTRIYQTFEGPRTVTLKAHCVVCASLLYVFENGTSGDPRGAIKERNNYDPLIASEYGKQGADVPACFACMNDAYSYRRALRIAQSRWDNNDAA